MVYLPHSSKRALRENYKTSANRRPFIRFSRYWKAGQRRWRRVEAGGFSSFPPHVASAGGEGLYSYSASGEIRYARYSARMVLLTNYSTRTVLRKVLGADRLVAHLFSAIDHRRIQYE